jgi:hypothetical protein
MTFTFITTLLLTAAFTFVYTFKLPNFFGTAAPFPNQHPHTFTLAKAVQSSRLKQKRS